MMAKDEMKKSDGKRKRRETVRTTDGESSSKQSVSGGPERFLSGLPELKMRHPRAVLIAGGRALAIADGPTVVFYAIEHCDDGAILAREKWRRELRGELLHLLSASGDRLLAIFDYEGHVRLEAVKNDATSTIATLPGRPSAVAVAGNRLLAAIHGTNGAAPRLVEVDLASGARLADSPLASSNVEISTSPSGRFVAIVDRIARTMAIRDDRGTTPCPPPPQTGCDYPPASPPHGPSAEPNCCARAGSSDERGSDEKRREEERKRAEDEKKRRAAERDPCPPVDAAIPDDRGGAIVSNGGRVGRRPGTSDDDDSPLTRDCWGNLLWVADRIKWVNSQYLLATSGNYMRRMAVLAAKDLQVLQEREFGHDGALVFSAPDSDGIVVYHPAIGRFEWVKVADDQYSGAIGIIPAFIVPAEEKTFVGQHTLSLLSGHVRTKGEIKVLVLPVVEPGQAYGEPNLNKLAAFQAKNFFGIADAYYRENSFNQTSLAFKLFGFDSGVGPAGLPLPLPRAIGSYFFPPYFPGGIDLVKIVPLGVNSLTLEGSETLTLRVRPRPDAGSPTDFTLRFAAMLLRAEHDAFPVKIQTTGAELVVLLVRERDGTVRSMTLAFPATLLEIKESNITGGLAAIATFLDGVIATAEANAGVPGGRLFAKPVVRRVTKDGLEFGELHVSLSFANRPAGGGRLQVDGIWPGVGLMDLGFDDIIRARFAIAGDFPKFNDYLNRLVGQAQADKNLTFDSALLGTATASFDFPGSRIQTRFLIDNRQGGPGASITLVAASGLGQLSDIATPLPGSESTQDNAAAPKDMGGLINDAFSAAMARLRDTGEASPLTKLEGFDIVIVGFVMSGEKAPVAERWTAADPKDTGHLREAQTPFVAEDNADMSKPKKDRKQLDSRWILAMLDDEPSASTLCHELGHAYGFDDLYKQMDHRHDLAYLEDLALMDNHGSLPHHAGYHKWQADWIPADRIVDVPKPAKDAPTRAEALLVPVEYWDSGMEAAVRAAYPGVDAKIAQLMRIDLGGDMGMFDIVEARQRGNNFSQHLPAAPFLLVTNAIVPWDRTRYAVEGKYRREVHKLSSPGELNADEEEFDLATAPELPAKGVKVRILDIRTVNRPGGAVRVFHTLVTRELAEFIDVAFTIGDPYYRSPDLWLDWPVVDGQLPFIYPEGAPTHQGKPVQVPKTSDPNVVEPHALVARVRNHGNIRAVNVKIDFFVNRPPGGGDKGAYQRFAQKTIAEVKPGTAEFVVGIWNVNNSERGHTCLRAVIVDSDVPNDELTGITLGSADVFAVNNHCEKNVDVFVPLGGSPYEPVEFDYSVNNSGLRPETAFLQPEGLTTGMMLTISPPRRAIAPGETAFFRCRLELDHEIIDAGCPNDRDFTITTWRETGETAVDWGGCLFKVRPRKKTTAIIKGGWYANDIVLDGRIDPDPSGGDIRLRINFNNQKARFQTVKLGPGGIWKLDLVAPAGAGSLETESFYEGSRIFAPCRSPLIMVVPYVVR